MQLVTVQPGSGIWMLMGPGVQIRSEWRPTVGQGKQRYLLKHIYVHCQRVRVKLYTSKKRAELTAIVLFNLT